MIEKPVLHSLWHLVRFCAPESGHSRTSYDRVQVVVYEMRT